MNQPTTTDSKGDDRLLSPDDAEGLDRMGSFAVAARLIVEGYYAGKRRSPFHDRSAEFADYRQYTPGDDVRSLDWKAFARTDRDYIRLTRKETELPCHLLIDTSASMAFSSPVPGSAASLPSAQTRTPDATTKPETARPGHRDKRKGCSSPAPSARPQITKSRYAAYLAAAISYLLIREGEKVGLAAGARNIERYHSPAGSGAHLHKLLSALEGLSAAGPTDVAACVRELFRVARRKGLLIVVSDLIEPFEVHAATTDAANARGGPSAAALFDALGLFLHGGWQVMLLQVLTPAELSLKGIEAPARFRDSESEGTCEANPDAIRAAYCDEMGSWLNSITTLARARGIQHTLISTDTHYIGALERVFSAGTQATSKSHPHPR